MTDKILIDAIAYALSREVVPSDEYYNRMSGIQRRQAVSIAGLGEIEQIKYVLDQVNKSLAEGKDFDEFKRSVKLKDIELPEYRLKTIFQTNVQQAYSHGRWLEQQRNKQDKPYLRYVAVNDSRTRPAHRALHGTVRHIDDPFWQSHTPPCDFNCRCIAVALSEEEAREYGITSDDDLPDVKVADGFGHTPEQYNTKMTQLVSDRVAETMIEYYKQATTVGKIRNKVTTAIGRFLKKPIAKLAALIVAAKKLLGIDDSDDE